ncbi:MAG: bacteriocin-protection protein [Nevskiaceae bacterium]|nr:MAG: bacteriocin-protection protein [Nevskiaceae bacterium]
MTPQAKSPAVQHIHYFEKPVHWEAWLSEHHASSPGIWLQLAKKGAGASSVSYDEAVEVALCYGWIDGQKKAHSDQFWLQKFTRRSNKSLWSKINRDKALTLVKAKKMKPAGLQEIERAKLDGRWDAAYDSFSKATVPGDFQAALEGNARAQAFFATLDSRNRYAVLFRIQTAKKAETRAKRISQFVLMLERHEKVHP